MQEMVLVRLFALDSRAFSRSRDHVTARFWSYRACTVEEEVQAELIWLKIQQGGAIDRPALLFGDEMGSYSKTVVVSLEQISVPLSQT